MEGRKNGSLKKGAMGRSARDDMARERSVAEKELERRRTPADRFFLLP